MIFAVGVLAPLLAYWTPRLRLPVIVLEIGLGILVGPEVLHWGEAGPVIDALARLGLSFLFFLAGFEIDFKRIRGRPLRLAMTGWLLSLGLAMLAGQLLKFFGIVSSEIVTPIILTSTALGVLSPILKDAGEEGTAFGTFVQASGVLGEFGPIVMISVLLTTEDGGGGKASLFIALFILIAIFSAYLAARLRPHFLVEAFRERMHTSSALPLRACILILVLLVILTRQLGLESILGAFTAGIVVSLASSGKDREVLRQKLEGIGYGFLIPIFFVTSGMNYNLTDLISSPRSLLRLPLFLALFLVVRGLPALLFHKDLPRKDLLPLALFSSTTLPLVIAVTTIGVKTGQMLGVNAAALVGAGMISVFLFPALALWIRQGREPAGPSLRNPEPIPIKAGTEAG